MKNIYNFVALFTILVCIANKTQAQIETIMEQNDSLIVALNGYKGGEIYWECTTDIANHSKWMNIGAARNATTLKHKLITPYYFRSKVVDGTCEPLYSDTIKTIIGEFGRVKAGHGYAEPYDPYNPGISMAEKGKLSNWNNLNRNAVWYLYQKAGNYQVQFLMNSTRKNDFQFEMNTSPCYEGLGYTPQKFNFTCSAKGSAKKDTITVFNVTIPTTGYYRYELTALNSMDGLTIEELLFNGFREPGQTTRPGTNATDYLSSPSVHLTFRTTANTTGQYDWIYQEILVPEGYDPLYSYWMSLGFYRGYMGIQTNSENERRVLFSAWDAVDKDKYPNAPKELLVSLVDKADYTQANAFGNEGTGGQSFVGTGNPDTWKTGTPVKFLMNTRRVGQIEYNGDIIRHSVVSAWFDAGEGWKYIATWRVPIMPDGKDAFDGFYSFLENYGFRNGQIARKGYYYNAFGREDGSNRWVHFNKTSFGNTDGGIGQRVDFEQGVSDEDRTRFYMLSGGYGPTKKAATEVPLIASTPSFISELDIDAFSARVDEALEFEALMNNLPIKEKTDWSVLSFTSQETTGEANGNGRAALIIDGNMDSYWHSQWKNKTASFPHRFVIDMGKDETIKGFRITSSVGATRYPKNIKIECSDTPLDIDSPDWENNMVLHVDASNAATNTFRLNQEKTFRYFRFSILSGHNDDAHTRINEVDVF